MEKRINWLHITDLHYGQNGQQILLSKIKQEFFKDIEYIKDEIGKIDIVFFTGDLTQSGKKEEFDQLTVFLNELWALFKKLNSEPFLVAIPGNHDLERPDPKKAAVKVLNNYHTDNELQESLWTNLNEQSEYYEVIQKCFYNYCEWYKNVPIRKPDLKYGLIPGDISTTVIINGVSLNIVGLNTAFLELGNNDYKGKLALNPYQFLKLIGNDHLKSAASADLSILLTHHDPSWYDQQSIAYYNNDINPAQTYYAHLCGHLHEANTFSYNITGSTPRKTQLAPSLFGLQKINNNIDRIHGYYAGSYLIEDNTVREIFYPRKALMRYGGDYAIDADIGFNLGKKGFVETIYISNNKQDTQKLLKPSNDDVAHKKDLQNLVSQENILDLRDSQISLHELAKIPKSNFKISKQHTAIRLVEQKNFIDLIRQDNLIWLITDWGLNETGFIGSISEDLKIDNFKESFVINCEDLATTEELLEAFETQFGMPLQRFCILAEKLKHPLLVFDHLNVNLYYSDHAYSSFINIITSILDYCPQINIILIARQSPLSLPIDKYVRLAPLDIPQIKTYVENHPSSVHELENSENLLKLEQITSGLPKHIDRIIDSLKVTTLEELLETERENSKDFIVADQIPKSLVQAINNLVDSGDRLKKRSFNLLKILTVLANGETFSNLYRFNANEPIYIENANELEGLSLLEVITSNRIISKVSGNQQQAIKILRIPRQIRDYVNTLITENEQSEILRLACNLYFGNKWREGNIKDIYGSSLLQSQKFFNADNCYLIINNLINTAIKNNDDDSIERSSLIAINFCTHVYKAGDYKNAISTAEEVYNILKTTTHNRIKATLAKILGESLRMAGNREKSLRILTEALETGETELSNSEKNDIYTDLGYSYLMDSNFQKAIQCAKAIEKTTTAKDLQYIQAKYILAQATLTDEKLLKRLKSLENEAKKVKSETLANSISLKIAELNNNKEDRKKRFSKILTSKNDDYNKMRALVKKSMDVLKLGDGEISNNDLLLLNYTYSYLYAQRMGILFTNCHIALWLYCKKNNRVDDMLNLYKHSSLVWRISGDYTLEKDYFKQIKQVIDNQELDGKMLNLEYFNRRKLELK